MTKPRDTSLPQHHYSQGHYGELPFNSMPSGTHTGQTLTHVSTSGWAVDYPVLLKDEGNTLGRVFTLNLVGNNIVGTMQPSGVATITVHSSGGASLIVEEQDGSPSVTSVNKIKFSGATVIDEGGGIALVTMSGGTGSGLDEKVKVTSNDTTAEYLFEKLVAGTNVTLVENNNGGDESITIQVTSGSGGGGSQLGAGVVNSVNQAIATAAERALGWNTEQFDNGGYYNNAFLTRLTVPTGQDGLHAFDVNLRYSVNTTGYFVVRVNSGTIVGFAPKHWDSEGGFGMAAGGNVLNLNAGDYLEVFGLSTAANNVVSPGAGTTPAFSIQRIGGGTGVAGTFVGVKAYHSTTQSINNATETAVLFDSEDFDADNLHNTSSNTERITVNRTGVWRFTYRVRHSSVSATGARYSYLRINGTTKVEGSEHSIPGSTTADPTTIGTADVELTTGDYIEVLTFQNSGSARDIGFAHATNAAAVNSFSAQFLASSVIGSSAFAGAKAYADGTQSISDATTTAVALNQEEFDIGGFHDNATDNSRFTVPVGKAGKYLLMGGVTLAAGASPVIAQLWWRLNGTTGIRAALDWVPSSGVQTGFTATTIADLVAGDYVELMFYQDSSGARNIGHASAPEIQSFGVVSLIGTSESPANGTLLAYKSHTAGDETTTSTTLADLDATNAAVTFSAPASGNVLVRLSAGVSPGTTANAYCAWGLREDTTNIAGGAADSIAARASGSPGADPYVGATKTFVLTGISAGLHTYKWSWSISAGTATLIARAASPAVMEVWALDGAISDGSVVLANEFRNFPSLENADDTQPEWWEEEAASTAVLTEVDVVGESITESYERALKVVTTADDYAYQLFTYADEPRLKVGKTVSVRMAVWAVSGVTARTRIQSSVGSLGVASSTAAAWTIQTVSGVVLDGTTVEVRLEVNNGTAYFVPLAFGIGGSAPNALAPRGLAFKSSATRPAIETLDASSGKAFGDIDVTSNTSPLAVRIAVHLYMEEGGADGFTYGTRPNGSSLASGGREVRRGINTSANTYVVTSFIEFLDDAQIFESELIRNFGSGSIAACAVNLDGWWEWE